MARIAFAWEIGARRGHTGPMLPVAAGLACRGHTIRLFLRDVEAAKGLPGSDALETYPAPRWYGSIIRPQALNVGEILLNFGFHEAEALGKLVDAWRERLEESDLLISNVAPAAMVAAHTLGLAALEISQGYHVPPNSFPSPPLRDWQPAPRQRLEDADRRVLAAINAVLQRHAKAPIHSLGELFVDRNLLQTYPELDMYPERGSSEYFGIVPVGGGEIIDWPEGRPRVLAYVYADYAKLESLLEALSSRAGAAVVICPGIEPRLRIRYETKRTIFSDALLDFQKMAEGADIVVGHGSHQTTAETLLQGRPLLLLPTQLEQFLTTRRVVQFGAGLGVMGDIDRPDFGKALETLVGTEHYAHRAQEFAQRYVRHDRATALTTLIDRCEAAASQRVAAPRAPRFHIIGMFDQPFGAERRALALYRDLRAAGAEVSLWSPALPHSDFSAYTIEVADSESNRFPSGGTLVVSGTHLTLGDWFGRAWFERVVLIYNVALIEEKKLTPIERLRRGSVDPDIVYASRMTAEQVGLPGVVEPSFVDTSAFVPSPGIPEGRFVVGRLSRDYASKHHPADARLYRRLLDAGIPIRIMGGSCLSASFVNVDGIELLPELAEPAPRFLQTLDAFIYRTDPGWLESFGRVILEAMSCGLPVVCERRGGYIEHIEHGETGFLFDTEEEAYAMLLRLREDRALRQRIGYAARRAAQRLYSSAARKSIVDWYLVPKDRH